MVEQRQDNLMLALISMNNQAQQGSDSGRLASRDSPANRSNSDQSIRSSQFHSFDDNLNFDVLGNNIGSISFGN